MRHCSTELRKQVLPMFSRPAPIRRTFGHSSLTRSGGKRTTFGTGRPSTCWQGSPTESEKINESLTVFNPFSLAFVKSKCALEIVFFVRNQYSTRIYSGYVCTRIAMVSLLDGYRRINFN